MAGADAIASILLDRLLDAISEEIKRVEYFERELNMMRDRFVNIKNLLDNKDSCNEPRVQDTLPRFRDLMYEADDVLTDCKIRQKYQENELCNFFPCDIFFKLKTSRRIEDINKNMEDKFKILAEYSGVKIIGSSPNKTDDLDQFTWTYDPSDDIIGIDDDVQKIKGWILSQDYKNQKIGIVGMGGLGKTTIVKIIFNDSEVNSHFNKKIWVEVSRVFQVEKILRSILQQLGENFDEQPTQGGSKTDQMLDLIMSQLKKQSCLIILDDMWDNERLQWWDKFVSCALDLDSERCCFIITTRDEDVASVFKFEVSRFHRPEFLNAADSWTLFRKKAFSKIKEGSDKLEPLGQIIVVKCKGLPLAIKTIRGLLGSTDTSDKWEEIGRSFCEANITKANAVMNSLQQSYKELPPHLKQCLLCFSIFPEKVAIEAEKLIHWWVGEGLIQGTDKMSATEIGFDYLSKLVSRCLVEVVERRGYNGRVYKCKMHDLVRDLTIVMAQDEKLCCFDNGGEQKLDKDSRWLGFTSEIGAKSLNQSPKLRALLLMSRNLAPFDRNLGSLGSLRALDLSNNELDNTALSNLLNWISALKRLAYLNLTGAQGLLEVPDSICKLRNLQVLVLRECINLSKLSPSVTQLKNLIVLDLGCCDRLSYLPRGLGRLSQLQELSGLRFDRPANRGSCLLGELGQLGELRVLQMHLGKDSQITMEGRDVLSRLNKLKVLAITFDDNQNLQRKNMLEILVPDSPPPELEQLYLKRYRESLPNWVSVEKLCKLKYLCVDENCLVDTCTSNSKTTWNLEALHLNVLEQEN